MSAYFIALIDIHDPEGYEGYLAAFDTVFERFGGRVIAVEDSPRVLEGEWPAGRTVVIRFDDEAELRRWYDSSEYREIARHRREASVCNVAVVTGRD